jgi:glycosyltransferase involved in cell wall biosynthesis
VTRLTVSVLTPSFNQARWLAENLRSVAAQSYPGIEHLVSDGGSTDGSIAILTASSASVAWESAPDLGQSDAINKAFSRSSGDIIGWLNSDDAYFSTDAVAEVVRIFDDDPAVGLVYGHAALVNASGTLLQILWSPPYRAQLLRWYNYLYQPSVFVRRSALGRPNFVDPAFDYMMDRELWLHLATRCRFKRLDRIVSIDRHHLGRKSYTRLDLAEQDQEKLVERYRLSRARPPLVQAVGARLGFRLAGLTSIREASRGANAIELAIPSLGTLALRQAVQLRRWMSPDDGADPDAARVPEYGP